MVLQYMGEPMPKGLIRPLRFGLSNFSLAIVERLLAVMGCDAENSTVKKEQ